MRQPGISIITVCRNAEHTIEQAIKSVLSQSIPDIEYIVIDGGSTDGTLKLIQQYADRIHQVISEPDRGIADAFNKGVARATKEYIGFLNADDELVPGVLAQMTTVLAESGNSIDILYGDALCVDKGRVRYTTLARPLSTVNLLGPFICHQAMLARRSLFDLIGGFDERYRFGMDYDWILRAKSSGARFHALDNVAVAYYSVEGFSAQHAWSSLVEFRAIARANRMESRLRLELYYLWKAIKFWIQRVFVLAGLGNAIWKMKARWYSKYAEPPAERP